jgi:tetratricopeptide (TPR) repeat protein
LRETAESAALARQAIELGRDDAVALRSAGNVLDYLIRDFEAGAIFIDRSRALNPNLAPAWCASGWARVHLGHPGVALAHFAEAMRLSPVDPMMFLMQTGMACAHFIAGRSEEAASWAEHAWREKPNWLNTLRIGAASHGLPASAIGLRLQFLAYANLIRDFRVSSAQRHDFCERMTSLDTG